MKTLFGSQSETQSTNTRAALAKAFATADAQLPQKQRAIDFLTTHLEPALSSLLEQRAAILRGKANADGLDALARAELAPGAGPPQSSSLNADLPTVERAIQVKRRAIELQRAIVDRTRAEWSAVVCDQLATVHRQQVRRIAAAIEELSDALLDHRHLVEELDGHDVANFSYHLRPMLFPRDTMQLDDESSSASWWMNDARAAGLLD